MSQHPDQLILAKALALVRKTRNRVVQVDSNEFPTASSTLARELLLKTLDALAEEARLPAVAPGPLYISLIHMQSFVAELEASNSKHISWPLVSYCDQIWKQFFPAEEAQIFYSVMTEHNYGISSFSDRLEKLVATVLPPSRKHQVFKGYNLYCLQLASLEDENLPLYANIGHEFGHALFHGNEKAIVGLLNAETADVFLGMGQALDRLDADLAPQRKRKVALILKKMAVELFCDLVGVLTAGPAFLLSLHEMGWGVGQNVWKAALYPNDARTKAYPSYAFRLHCLKTWPGVLRFEEEAKLAFHGFSKRPALDKMAAYLATLPSTFRDDSFVVSAFADQDNDVRAIQDILGHDLGKVQAAFERFFERCKNEFLTKAQKETLFPAVSAAHVFELLHRLESNILPNIIPDSRPDHKLLGIPASFSSILNASALFRADVLLSCSRKDGTEAIFREIQKVERLTAKALEVSYIQGEFNAWRERSKDGRSK